MLALTVQSHRPPFRKDHHITGHNLFVSGYHGFAQLDNEHVPVPRAFEDFPPLYCEFHSASVVDVTSLSIRFRVRLDHCTNPSRYRLAVRLQLTTPGGGRRPGYLRSFVAQENCYAEDSIVEVLVPDTRICGTSTCRSIRCISGTSCSIPRPATATSTAANPS